MPSPRDKLSPEDWRPYPLEDAPLSRFRLILPIAEGIYGQPRERLAIVGNHQARLHRFAKQDDLATLALDSGGFPTEIALAFGLFSQPPAEVLKAYADYVGGEVEFCVSPALAAAWGWKNGEQRSGGRVCVDSRLFPPSVLTSLPSVLLRLYAALRLALAQIALLGVPLFLINARAFIPAAAALFMSALSLAVLWKRLPGNVWGKAALNALVWAALAAALAFWGLLALSPPFIAGVFLLMIWSGGALAGARSLK